ncbi:pyrimidine-nucleoside phosphorylase [Paenibacillus albiflavus]|uniref:Pyrimidine-nucleoside phosphorylase n=1 Tax=Paenibacillus albiflavus TaxID=2545760 RepID=A0A4R4E963_9BACL|nr:pyrimidine-nucleoside phosphorylase [Paenibacillus albiflavus]TCZ75420.1 pyrimidine-nucleoside phosphorylase [Paenibacillus albiflavus]
MRMVDLIERKRDGHELTKQEIDYIVEGYTDGSIPDYQMSSLLMAIFFRGMTPRETSDLTLAMVNSGDTIDLSAIEGIKVDKHSTGGVGDTTTIVLAPLVASVGVPVAKLSGRGLGHTGGTVDKFESISGFHVEIENAQFIKQVNEIKVAVTGSTGNLAPADKKMYGLRDVTGTVNSIPLIASSIMSKKIASGSDAIVLDVKVGAGAFMKDINDAKKLAQAMVEIGSNVGRNTMAIISDMNQPLGYAIGNALEVKEAIDTLRGEGPADLHELCITLGSHMVLLAKHADNIDEARQILEEAITSGKALQKFKEFIEAQGGDSSIIDDPSKLPAAKHIIEVKSQEDGYVSKIVADSIGTAAMILGAGRATKESVIDLSVGLVLHKKIGDEVKKGDTLVSIYSNTESVDEVMQRIYESYQISAVKVDYPTLVYAEIHAHDSAAQ